MKTSKRLYQFSATAVRNSALCEFLQHTKNSFRIQYKTPDEVYFGICNSANKGYIRTESFTQIFKRNCPAKGAGALLAKLLFPVQMSIVKIIASKTSKNFYIFVIIS